MTPQHGLARSPNSGANAPAGLGAQSFLKKVSAAQHLLTDKQGFRRATPASRKEAHPVPHDVFAAIGIKE